LAPPDAGSAANSQAYGSGHHWDETSNAVHQSGLAKIIWIKIGRSAAGDFASGSELRGNREAPEE
jgi:hypothetical protein